MVYFIDDLNMPALDKYNTQTAIELMRQLQDPLALCSRSLPDWCAALTSKA